MNMLLITRRGNQEAIECLRTNNLVTHLKDPEVIFEPIVTRGKRGAHNDILRNCVLMNELNTHFFAMLKVTLFRHKFK